MARWTTNQGYNAYRGNRSRNWRTNTSSQNRAPTQTETPEPPVGTLKRTLTVSHVANLAQEQDITEAKIEHVRYVASYNLPTKASDATIIVPGQPPRWTPSRHATQLQQDSGVFFRDRNAAKFPKHPIAPAVAACLATAPALQLADVDIFACASTLGNLLRFVREVDGRDEDKRDEEFKYRMLVEKCGRAIFLIRREKKPDELIPDVYGYGHTFPEAFTTWDPEVKNSDSHQRIISYRFGGLKLLVRAKADGYFARDGHAVAQKASPTARQDDSSLDSLAAALVDMAPLSSRSVSADEADLAVHEAGHPPDQSQIFDIKTRSLRTIDVDHLGKELPRLWVAQIPQFVLAFHKSGLFRPEDIHVRDARSRVQAWEAEHQEDLDRLAALLHLVVEECNNAEGDGKMEIIIDRGTLKFCEQVDGASGVLPPELRARWEAVGTTARDAPGVETDVEKD